MTHFSHRPPIVIQAGTYCICFPFIAHSTKPSTNLHFILHPSDTAEIPYTVSLRFFGHAPPSARSKPLSGRRIGILSKCNLASDSIVHGNSIRNHNCLCSGLRIFIFVVRCKVFIKIQKIGCRSCTSRFCRIPQKHIK